LTSLLYLFVCSFDVVFLTLSCIVLPCSLIQVHPEGKFVVDIDKNIDMNQVTPNCRVALRNDSYVLHKILPNKVCSLHRQKVFSFEDVTPCTVHIA
jgi:ATP-dependent 26S proteasome regulatory subunit